MRDKGWKKREIEVFLLCSPQVQKNVYPCSFPYKFFSPCSKLHKPCYLLYYSNPHTHFFFLTLWSFITRPYQKKKIWIIWLESELFLTSVIRKWVPTCLRRWWVFTVKHTWSTLESLVWGISTCWSFFVCGGCRWGCLTAHGAGEGPWRQVSEALLWCDQRWCPISSASGSHSSNVE